MHNCNWCTKKYTTRGKLKNHIAKHHPNDLQSFVDSVSKCPHCNLKFERYSELGGHLTWCGITEDQRKLYISKLSRGHPVSSITKQKLSVIRSKYLEEVGGGGFSKIKWYKVSNVNNEEFVLRGSWELQVANWLNSMNVEWVRKVYLSYEKDGIQKTYCPDFYLPAQNIYLEVKGYFSEVDKCKLTSVVSTNKIDLKVLLAKEVKLITSNQYTIDNILNMPSYN